MTELRRLALSVVMPGFVGTTSPTWLRAAVAEGLGGVCLFGHNVETAVQVRELTDGLHALGAVLVASDEEGGSVSRLEVHDGSRWPGAAALGALDDPSTTMEVARGIGAQARAAGVDLVLAPVLDVGSEPDNPVIGVRSFGAGPGLVSRHGAAFVRGLAEAGVAACGKHFPGHGDTRTDSHLGLPVVGAAEATWRGRDLPPFAGAIEAGMPCVMTAHLVLSWLDPVPATLSPRVLRLLREELDFTGVIASDALDMKAISHRIGRGPAAVAAVAAGVDLVCLGNPAFPASYDDRAALEEVVDALVAAVRDGTLARERLVEASGRVAVLAAGFSGGESGPGAPTDLAAGIEVGVDVARRALAIRGDVRLRADPVVLTLPAELGMAAGERPSALLAELRRRRPRWAIQPVVQPDVAAEAAARAAADGGEVVVVVEGTAVRHDLVQAVLTVAPAAVIVYGSLRRDQDPGLRTIHTHGTGAASAVAVVGALLGAGS